VVLVSLIGEFIIRHRVGDSFRYRLTLTYRETEEDLWSPMNLTGFQVAFGVGRTASRGTAKCYWSADKTGEVQVVDAPNGVIELNISAEHTHTWWEQFERFTLYELILVSGEEHKTILEGPLELQHSLSLEGGTL
jgi:hypothetical protein